MNRFDLYFQRSRRQLLGLLLLGCFATINLQAQSARLWEKTYGMRSTEEIQAIVTKPNGDHLMGGYVQESGSTFQFYLIRTDVDGDLIYEKDFGEMTPEFSYDLALTDDGVIMVGEKRAGINEPGDVLVMKISDAGEVLTSKSFGGSGRDIAQAVIPTSDGGYALAGETENANGDADMFLLKLNADGDSIWMKTFDNNNESDKAFDLVEKADNSGFVIVGKSGNVGADMFLVETDLNGNEVNRKVEVKQGNLDARAIVNSPTGYLVAGAFTEFSARGFISKIEFDLSVRIFSYGNGDEQGFKDIIESSEGTFIAGGFILLPGEVTIRSFMVEVNETLGVPLNQKEFGGADRSREINGLSIAGNKKGIVAAGQIFDFIVPNAWFLRVENGLRIPEKFIEGNVFFDTQGNCSFDLGVDSPLSNWIVTCEGANETLFATTDENGNYFFRVDDGTYTINLKVDNETWEPCFNGNQIVINEAVDTLKMPFPVKAEHDCVYMEIDASAPKLEICEATDFQVFYCNKGTVDAQNAQVEVILDKYLTINSSTLPITQPQTDSLYIFDLGEVKAGDCGKFTINATLDCNEPVLNQTHYFSARITPDSICIPTDLQWDGSSIEVSARCDADSVRFTVTNVGDDMTQARQALVIEDHLFLRPAPFEPLDSGATKTISAPADGTTYRIVVEQSEFHPGKSTPTVAIEGCVQTPGTFTTGFITGIEEDEKNPFVSIEPMENEPTTTDFTFLRGYPNGVLDSLITSQTDLEYHFRFENLGDDTLKRVVIRDTLSQNLDITSIRYGTSSHPYSFRVYETGVVKFIFDDINLLPITTVNKSDSRGFVKFKISQKPNNPAGTVIVNKTAMNQDFDMTEISNSTRHYIGGDSLIHFIEVKPDDVSTSDKFFPGVNVNIFPNPAVSHVTFEVSGVKFKEYRVEIFDLSGKLISHKIQAQNRFTLNRESLNEGIQLYRVTADGNLLSTGKIIVQ